MQKTNEILLFISGPVGVGKTTVGNELSSLLEANEVPHTFIDLDALTNTFPRNASDPYGNALALDNLIPLWKNSRNRGSKNLIISRVVESTDYALEIATAVGINSPIVCRLSATDKTLLERVRTREIGSNLTWHEKRSLELSAELTRNNIEDFFIATDARSITTIAAEIMEKISWHQ